MFLWNMSKKISIFFLIMDVTILFFENALKASGFLMKETAKSFVTLTKPNLNRTFQVVSICKKSFINHFY